MRLEWLEDILSVAETGSFSEAAERRGLTQSAFSRRIRNIEDYVGVELFDRSHKPVQLSPVAEDQSRQIARAAIALRQLANDLRLGDRRSTNRVVIASQHALTTGLTPGIIQAVQTYQKDIFVRLRSANLDECYALLLSRQADIALVYQVPGADQRIEADYIETMAAGADRLIPISAAGLATEIGAGQSFADLPVIAYPGRVFLGQVLEQAIFSQLGSEVHIVPQVETALTLAAMELAVAGVGVAWVPASLCKDHVLRGRLVDLSQYLPACDLSVVAIRLAGRSGQAEDVFWELLTALHEG
ncbi:LysR family transcriptional regulator [Rhodophyticola sp. CCM32]|uniref:LysR family transcriptional regulator n=1 Tax=Rhodophyticola sp. CCM32 TaxID=2916397 RepID=UPI00107F0018|nr:LysR family transcriptional regulator [Rhodophyticola sp. CCM32]QBY01393.1 LysR family transcriptional regulator [Rhodophyticola sp. CCM32]